MAVMSRFGHALRAHWPFQASGHPFENGSKHLLTADD